ncbi:MAG: hypothetical protein N2322_06745, partial [Terrimicrobiaceae bacterium]|nr:hypothetical protein [Terrimicrobiaceae bacterium]
MPARAPQITGAAMRNTISFMSANFVARELGYPGGDIADWARHDQATQEAFRPIETFQARFEEMLDKVRGAGFDALDLWCAHLHYRWATPE